MKERRVVITGLGVVSPHGCDTRLMFDALMRGESAVRPITLKSDVGTFESVGATVLGEPWAALSRGERATSDKVSAYALLACDAAIRDSALDFDSLDPSRVGVMVGTCLGGVGSEEAAYSEIFCKQKTRLNPFTLVKVMYNGPASQIALRYRVSGPTLTYTTTCSSSTVSIGEGMRHIRHGYADVILAGGAEALFAYVSIKAWLALQVLAPALADNPAATCRPFSLDRNGTVLGDGAAFVVLEERNHAVSRGARIYGNLAGYGVCNDSLHLTQPSVEAQARAMQLALDDADLAPYDIDYLNAHGTGTPLNDLSETQAIKKVFGDHAAAIAVSSTKSMHGHLVGAAGALELVISMMALERQMIPPTAHLDNRDPQCDLDYVPKKGRSAAVRAAMSNSFAVGGTAAVLVVSADPT